MRIFKCNRPFGLLLALKERVEDTGRTQGHKGKRVEVEGERTKTRLTAEQEHEVLCLIERYFAFGLAWID
jgi:hypothetical protein